MGLLDNLARSVQDLFHFDPSSYKNDISYLGEQQLLQEHKKIQVQLASIVTAGSISASTMFFMPGAAVPAGIALRRFQINTKRKEIIEQRLLEKRWPGYNMKFRDALCGVAPVALGKALIPGFEDLIDQGVSEVASQYMADHGADQVMNHTNQLAGDATDGTADHGVDDVGDRVASHVLHMAGDKTAGVDMINAGRPPQGLDETIYAETHSTSEQMAEKMGTRAVHKVAEESVVKVADVVAEQVSNTILSGDRPRKTISSQSDKPSVGLTKSPEDHHSQKPDKSSISLIQTPEDHQSQKPEILPTKVRASGELQATKAKRCTATTPQKVKPNAIHTNKVQKEVPLVRLAALLMPVVVYSVSGHNIFWLPTAFETIATLRYVVRTESAGLTALLAVPLVVLYVSSERFLWLLYVLLVLQEAISWRDIVRVVQLIVYSLAIFLGFVVAGIIFLSVLFPTSNKNESG